MNNPTKTPRLSYINAFIVMMACIPLNYHTAAFSEIYTNNDVRKAQESNAIGLELLNKRDYRGAERRFADAIALDAGVKIYFNNIAVALMNQGNYAAAAVHLEKAIELDPIYARALSNMAISCFYLSRYRKAFYYYHRASKADRAYTESRFELGKVVSGMEKMHRDNPEDATLKTILKRVKNLDSLP